MIKVINNRLIAIIAILLITAGCSKNSMDTYQEKPAIYFASFTDKDSLVYSFAGKINTFDTLFLTINVLGNKQAPDRAFKLSVNPSATDAIEGTHYEKLKSEYILPKDVFSVRVPVILYKTDPSLSTRFYSLGITIQPSEEIAAGYPSKLNARIVFTNQLVKPIYWDNLFALYYGVYSRVKHEACIRFQGHDFPPTQAIAIAKPYSYSYWMSFGRVVCTYFTNNIVYDENGDRIVPWAAF